VERAKPREELVIELPDYMRVDTLEKAFGVSRSTLQSYNPALLPPVWEGAKYVPRGFRLRLPVGGVIDAAPHDVLAAIPGTQRYAAQVPDKTHKVRRGDTLSGIARRYGTSVAKLAQANGIRPGNRIYVGQTLRLPVRAPAAVALAEAGAPAPAVAPAKPAERAPAVAPPKPEAPAVAAAPVPAGVPAPTAAQAPAEIYVVRVGDSLARIAERTGVSQRQLMALNDLADPDLVRTGQRLRLTGPAEPLPVATARAPAVEPPAAARPVGDAGGTAASLADPSDYLVAADDTVEVQAAETMSHYADWLEITSDALRRANGWPRQRSLVLGQRVRLVFDRVSREAFLARRVGYHHDLQEEYFARYRITDTTEHKLRRGESVWVLAAQKYKVPVWLLRQYNPTLDLDQLRPGTRVVFPRVVRVAEAEAPGNMAEAG
jgi:membrane-bound lytic murein transglycosylase D